MPSALNRFSLLSVAFAGLALSKMAAAAEFTVTIDDDAIRIESSTVEATVRKNGYVSGVYRNSFLDKKTGFRDVSMGLDIVDFLLEPGSDAAYRDELHQWLVYDFDNALHGKRAKRKIEGPQICTRAKSLSPILTRGADFVAISHSFTFYLAAPGKKPGSMWEQKIVFPAGKRYFLSSDRITSMNASDNLSLRIDMPGHIKHKQGDSFSEIYLSYHGRIPSKQFTEDFAPDEKFHYLRDKEKIPRRFIRAYRLRDPETGKEGPWLAGMTLDPSIVSEAWCHQREYVCMIQEFAGRPVNPGDSFSAAFIVGFFDSIEEMEAVYDAHAGHTRLEVSAAGWHLSN